MIYFLNNQDIYYIIYEFYESISIMMFLVSLLITDLHLIVND